ncbi:c-type cytochrome [Allopusillimonas ginsengisoli]|uniref:c-type cytochrome n=1 Tax=Allopusillimonas ginsengisoli TaxID=453575 RepID=UPI001020496E|nr:hypothetical protein [Allopusillimonas ginsengisoli]TEA77135.1 hypothetical protein ERE07_15975 [Allopusillimonas ginsengisoli]
MLVMRWKGAIITLKRWPVGLAICVALGVSPACIAQTTGDLQARDWAYSCATCHGIGHSAVKNIPTLAGMPADDIVKAMQAYASGERPGLLKQQMARGYDEAVLRRIGAWYESQPRDKEAQS